MNFHILTLFPEMVMQGLMTSITGRAVKQNKIGIEAVNIRDYTQDKHKKVDDYPYGGGAGMLMQAQPVYDAYRSVADQFPANAKKRVVYVTPQGAVFNQSMAEEFMRELMSAYLKKLLRIMFPLVIMCSQAENWHPWSLLMRWHALCRMC